MYDASTIDTCCSLRNEASALLLLPASKLREVDEGRTATTDPELSQITSQCPVSPDRLHVVDQKQQSVEL